EPVDERLPHLHLCRQLGQLELRVLEGGDRLAEGAALLPGIGRGVEGPPAGRDRGDGDADALLLQLLHQDLEAVALAAEQIPDPDTAALEKDLARVPPRKPEL